MSESAEGNRTYRRGEAVSTARSTTSIDTNILLRQADDTGLDTARSTASVDTDVLLGDLASARDVEQPRHGDGTEASLDVPHAKSARSSTLPGTEAPISSVSTWSNKTQSNLSRRTEAPIDSAYVQSTSLEASNSGTEDLVSNYQSTIPRHMRSSLAKNAGTEGDGTVSNYRPTSSTFYMRLSPPPMNSGTEDPLVSNCTTFLTEAALGTTYSQPPSLPPQSVATNAQLNSSSTQPASLPLSASSLADHHLSPDDLKSSKGQFHIDPKSKVGMSQFHADMRSRKGGFHADPELKVSKGQFHAGGMSRSHLDQSLVTARSVASAECAPVDYDDDDDDEDVRHRDLDHRGSSGFETFVSVQRNLSEVCPSTACPSYRSHGSSGFEVSMLGRCKWSEDHPSASKDRDLLYSGSSGFEASLLGRHKLYEDRPSVTNHHDFLHVGSSGVDASALKKLQLPETCRPVSVLRCGSSGFESPVLDQGHGYESDDTFCSVTGRSDASLDAAMHLRDSTFSPEDEVHGDSGTTSRTSASVDTNVLLQTTEDVVMAMEAARINHHSHSQPRDPSPRDGNHAHFRHEDIEARHLAREDVNHADEDYETETVDVGKTQAVPSRSSVLRKPPAAARGGKYFAASYGRPGTKEAWGTLQPEYEVPGRGWHK